MFKNIRLEDLFEKSGKIPRKVHQSGSDPLHSEEVHSVVNSNFGAAQEVAQPAAQFADQSFAQPETSSEPPR